MLLNTLRRMIHSDQIPINRRPSHHTNIRQTRHSILLRPINMDHQYPLHSNPIHTLDISTRSHHIRIRRRNHPNIHRK